MENRDNMNQTMSAAALCSGGCGFFGTPQFDGMCSVCFKESVKRRQQNTAAASMSNSTNVTDGGARVPSPSPIENSKPTISNNITTLDPKLTMESENISVTTVSNTQTMDNKDTLVAKSEPDVINSGAAAASVSTDADSKPDSPAPSEPATKTKKRTRCFTCKKKVGLTGFGCRCGGLYCGLHRYSDKHDCQFDYKKEGEELIRKNNPLVVGAKVEKI